MIFESRNTRFPANDTKMDANSISFGAYSITATEGRNSKGRQNDKQEQRIKLEDNHIWQHLDILKVILKH